MKSFGGLILAIGLIWALIAFNSDTTVESEGVHIGNSYFPGKKVQNIGLMDERRNHLMIACVAVVIGVILIVFSPKARQSADATRKCPFCAEEIKAEAKLCKHCGKDLPPIAREVSRLRVTSIADGEAKRRGLLVGDVIYAYAQSPVESGEALDELMQQHVGKSAPMDIIRGGQLVTLLVTAGKLGVMTVATTCDEVDIQG